MDPPECNAYLANEATKRWTSSNQVLVEMACTRSPKRTGFGKRSLSWSFQEDVAYHNTADFRRLLQSLVSAYRYNGDKVNLSLAKSEAKILHEKIKRKHYDHEEMIRILSTRSKSPINAMRYPYKQQYSAWAILKNYFEKVLRKAINRRGTDEEALTRVIATRAEVDVKIIKGLHHKTNSIPLGENALGSYWA